MKRILVILAVTVGIMYMGAVSAFANIDRSQATLITYNTAKSKAAIGHPWTFLGIHINMVGPQGGSIEWVGHYLLFRMTGDTFMNCSGEVEITPNGAVHSATIQCVYPPVLE